MVEDFSLHRMTLLDIYYRGGFGVICWVSATDYDRSRPDPLSDWMAEIIQHMNAAHKDALVLLAKKFARVESQEATWRQSIVSTFMCALKLRTVRVAPASHSCGR
jgi:hypothetical protein